METVSDVFGSIKEYIKGRFENPLYATYIVAWSCVNFRLLLVLFGEGSSKDKIRYIDGSLYTQEWHWFWFGFAYPLLVACAFVAAGPFVYRWVTVFIRTREQETIKQFLDVAKDTPMSPEAATRLRNMVQEERQLHKDELIAVNGKLHEFSEQMALLGKENAQLKRSVAMTDPLRELETRVQTAAESANTPPARIEAAVSEKYAPNEIFQFHADDFLGASRDDLFELLRTGLSFDEINGLKAIRNRDGFSFEEFCNLIHAKDNFSAKVLLERLVGLKLIKKSPSGRIDMTAIGRQALNKVLQTIPVL